MSSPADVLRQPFVQSKSLHSPLSSSEPRTTPRGITLAGNELRCKYQADNRPKITYPVIAWKIAINEIAEQQEEQGNAELR